MAVPWILLLFQELILPVYFYKLKITNTILLQLANNMQKV